MRYKDVTFGTAVLFAGNPRSDVSKISMNSNLFQATLAHVRVLKYLLYESDHCHLTRHVIESLPKI